MPDSSSHTIPVVKQRGRFQKGVQPVPHYKGCTCFRCDRTFWHGRKHTKETKLKISELQRKKVGLDEYRTKEWLHKKYWDEDKSYSEIGKEIGVSASWVQKWMETYKIPRRTEDFTNHRKMIGKGNPRWNGGNYMRRGYLMVANPMHSNSDSRGYVLKHLLVMSEYLGRPLEKNETVHHKNGLKDDNRIENLQLLKGGQREHQTLEQRILAFAKQLIWGDIKPELRKDLQRLFQQFLRKVNS